MSLPDLIFRFVIQIMIDVVEPIFLGTTFQVHLAVILSIWSLDNRENDEPNFRLVAIYRFNGCSGTWRNSPKLYLLLHN